MTDELMRQAIADADKLTPFCSGLGAAILRDVKESLAALEAALKPQYDQQALELCDLCGWKALIPGEGCLNCQRAMKPVEPVAWGIIASNTGRIALVELDKDEIANHNPKYIVPLCRCAPPAQTAQEKS